MPKPPFYKRWFKKATPETFIQTEWVDRIKPLEHTLALQFRDSKKGNAYWIKDSEELDLFNKEFRTDMHWIYKRSFVNKCFAYVLSDQELVVHFEPQTDEECPPRVYHVNDPIAQGLIQRLPENRLQPALLAETALFRAWKTVESFSLLVDDMIEKQAVTQHIVNMSNYPTVIDYFIKLEALLETPGAFNALTTSSDDMIDAFFEPLAVIQQAIKTHQLDTLAQSIDQQADVPVDMDALVSIINWSSTTLKELEDERCSTD